MQDVCDCCPGGEFEYLITPCPSCHGSGLAMMPYPPEKPTESHAPEQTEGSSR